MARRHARLSTNIWDDKDYRALCLADQGLFDGLMAYRGVSTCGVLDYIPSRLVRLSDGLTVDELSTRLGTLIERRFVVADTDTQELLLRTFIRHDGVLEQLNMGKSMVSSFDKVLSPVLRAVIVSELAKLWVEQPTLKGWAGVESKAPDLLQEVKDMAAGHV